MVDISKTYLTGGLLVNNNYLLNAYDPSGELNFINQNISRIILNEPNEDIQFISDLYTPDSFLPYVNHYPTLPYTDNYPLFGSYYNYYLDRDSSDDYKIGGDIPYIPTMSHVFMSQIRSDRYVGGYNQEGSFVNNLVAGLSDRGILGGDYDSGNRVNFKAIYECEPNLFDNSSNSAYISANIFGLLNSDTTTLSSPIYIHNVLIRNAYFRTYFHDYTGFPESYFIRYNVHIQDITPEYTHIMPCVYHQIALLNIDTNNWDDTYPKLYHDLIDDFTEISLWHTHKNSSPYVSALRIRTHPYHTEEPDSNESLMDNFSSDVGYGSYRNKTINVNEIISERDRGYILKFDKIAGFTNVSVRAMLSIIRSDTPSGDSYGNASIEIFASFHTQEDDTDVNGYKYGMVTINGQPIVKQISQTCGYSVDINDCYSIEYNYNPLVDNSEKYKFGIHIENDTDYNIVVLGYIEYIMHSLEHKFS